MTILVSQPHQAVIADGAHGFNRFLKVEGFERIEPPARS